MANFDYKQAFAHVKIDITKEMICVKGKTIPAQDIVGIGLGFTDIAKAAIANALGGVLGGAIVAKGAAKSSDLNKNLRELPKTRFAQMIITYKKENKQKFIRVPLTTMDETCVQMIHEIAKVYSNKFIGFGSLKNIEAELKVFDKAALIVVLVLVGGVLSFGIYAAMNPGSF